MTALVWFRNDLRSIDNTALSRAMEAGEARALFIATPGQWQHHHMAPVKLRLINHAVDNLGEHLAKAGVRLDVLVVEDFAAVPAALATYCREHQVSALYANREYLVNELARDNAVAETLACPCYFLDDALLAPPGSVLTQQGEPYKVFTPFKKQLKDRLLQHLGQVQPRLKGDAIEPPTKAVFSSPDCDALLEGWPLDEDAALLAMRRFVTERAADYKTERDFPSLDTTSRLSAALSIGLISVRQCLWRLLHEHGDAVWDDASGPGTWLNELIWRDFYQHVAWHFPRVVKGRAFQADTDAIAWSYNEAAFKAWCEGRTGYPIVDAAMRQLVATGWMHNRLRMIAASFLVKDLQLDWRLGETFFMRHLIDGDFAANNGGWQWAASTGTDAAPYFRIFNPTEQGKRFDPKGQFIRNWVPELQSVSDKYLFEPAAYPGALDYPQPIVNHKEARLKTLALFKAIKEG
ncbi:deoxyribodipyrimidine photo-lyase [Gallaecimonas pentaromativorans]|uniref:Deoxyribodipyrimidine photo-lyase n=1 Tax=Gallaecimonas pentaromativorans TaxID=584787 RepID=A0A3N1P7X1_9GAMM|nr:deoxyribodipyrimidine photo-lyase [Gallaecimonas pentaromativorans]ROQ27442.1 deoxyribodipyrimidine photo-lyase [Gallaecimonas pentaromativorans]